MIYYRFISFTVKKIRLNQNLNLKNILHFKNLDKQISFKNVLNKKIDKFHSILQIIIQ